VNLGALAAGATNTAQVVVQPTSSGKLTNLFRVFANETDPVLTNNSATVVSTVTNVVTVVTGADVQVFLTGPASSPPGSNITYTITVSNAGPSTSSNIVVKDAFPSAFAFVSASAGGTNGGGTVTWPTFAALLSGGSTILTLTVAAISSGTVTNIAFASAATIDPNPTNNNASLPASQAVTIVAPLQFTITAGPGVTQIGFNTYRVNTNAFNPQTGLYEESVTVTNIGVTTVEGVRLFVGGLRSGVTLWNATGTNGGVPYVEYDAPLYPANTLPPSSVTFTLEFYGLHVPFTNALTAVALTNDVMPTNSLNPATIYATNWVTITTNFVDMRIPGNKRFVFEFRSIPGTTYTIIYATNLTQTYWFIAVPPVTANANITQWYDDGPPKTLSQPMSTSSPIRFYQVFKN
jgi:uncharacterized repeat protein (TIGR01451 family)